MLIITLSYDNEKKTGNWVPMESSGAPQVNLLDVAEALSWAVFDTVNRIKQMQPMEEEKDDKET